jgi:hypothetical protein
VGDEPLSLADYKIGDEERMGQGSEGMFRFPEDAVATPGQVIVIARRARLPRPLWRQPGFEFYDADPAVPDMLPTGSGPAASCFWRTTATRCCWSGPTTFRDALNWGDSAYFFTPSVPPWRPGKPWLAFPASCDRDSAADWAASATAHARRCHPHWRMSRRRIPPPPDVELTGPIGAIQGSGAASPYLDEVVTFRGVVTGIQEHRNSRGAVWYTTFVQDDAAAADGDPLTSDGIAVFTATAHPSFQPGDIAAGTRPRHRILRADGD